MKKVVTMILTWALAFGLTACGGFIQKAVDGAFEIGKDALAIGEQFINGDIDAGNAKEQLQFISDELQSEIDSDGEGSGSSSDMIQAAIRKLSSAIEEGTDTESAFDALKNLISK